MSNTKANVSALTAASKAKTAKKVKRTKMNKVERTQNIVLAALGRTENNTVAELDRSKILSTLQRKLDMTVNQSSTYYHTFLRRHATGDEKFTVAIKRK